MNNKEFSSIKAKQSIKFSQQLLLVGVLLAYHVAFNLAAPVFAIIVLSFGMLVHELAYNFPIQFYPISLPFIKLGKSFSSAIALLLLALIWFVVFIPVAVFLKVFRKEGFLSTRINKELNTYWNDRDSKYFDFKRMEKSF